MRNQWEARCCWTGGPPYAPGELAWFARGLRRDQDAVTAGLTLEHSSGAVEGAVNRIKTLKQQMFGRAGFDLLRTRILLASLPSPEGQKAVRAGWARRLPHHGEGATRHNRALGSSTARGGCWSARTDVHLHRIGSFEGTAPLGALLGPELGAELVLIGTTRDSVAVPALHLDAPPEHRYFLSPGQPQPAPSAPSTQSLKTSGPGEPGRPAPSPTRGLGDDPPRQGAYGLQAELDPQEAFDAVIHAHSITPAHGADDVNESRRQGPPETVDL